MPYVTSIERLARVEGRQEARAEAWQDGWREGWRKGWREGWQKGRQEGFTEGFQLAILDLLELRFKKVAAKHARKVRSILEVERLQAVLRAVYEAKTL